LARRTYRWTAGRHTVELILPRKPASIRIDPDHKLLDMREDNNGKEF
jgi:hypothetical protein